MNFENDEDERYYALEEEVGDVAWIPSDEPGLVLDLDAHNLSSDGAVWKDKSGKGRHFSQPTSGKRFSFDSEPGPDGFRAVRCAAGKVMLCAGSPFSALTAAHIAVIWKFDNAVHTGGVSNGPWMFGSDTANGNYVPYSDGKIYDGTARTARVATNVSPSPAVTSWHLVEVVSTSSEWTWRQNGAQLFTTASNTVGFASTAYLGGNSATPDISLVGKIKRLIMYDHKLSAGARNEMLACFARRYSLPLL